MSSRLTARIFAIATVCAATTLVLAGCGGGGNSPTVNSPPPPPPPPATTPAPATVAIAQCIVNANNDVIIGGSNAKKGCDNVVMEAAASNQISFGDIVIAKGGSLTVTGAGASATSSAAGVAPRGSLPLAPLYIPLREICIQDGGKMAIGTATAPVTSSHKVYLKFYGHRDSDTSDKCGDFHKGILVMAGGSLLMYGAEGVPSRGSVSWTTLAAPAGSNVPGVKVPSTGTTTLELTADVTQGAEGWQPGDWIVVATTDFTPFESEFVQIASVTSGGPNGAGSTVTLRQPLKYYHFGSLAPSPATASCADPLHASLPAAPATQPAFLCDGADRNYGVDERAEVGLISRDIELTAGTEKPPTTPPAPSTSSVHWGGEIMMMPGFKQVAIQGVRLSKFGKDQLGSYPIHFHEIGPIGAAPNATSQTALIDADSIDHSYNHCVTIHSTSNLTISNLVCARIVGHIFYEEFMDATADNPADDSGIVFDHDLGIGAMSNSFDIYTSSVQTQQGPPPAASSRQDLINEYWWAGDYMTNAECASDSSCIHYDGFNIPDTDNQNQATHGSCYTATAVGGWTNAVALPCSSPNHYIEPASGFWIQNPGTVLVGDAIAGCQGVGEAFWWVTPPTPINVNSTTPNVTLAFQPLGTVKGDRASACYFGFGNDASIGGISSTPFTPREGAVDAAPSVIATLEDITATHNRFRGAWFRPTWTVINDGHFSTNRENVTLLSSGGIDGNAPGVWTKLENSVIIGESENNVERWGPCPYNNGGHGWAVDGCIDYSHPASGTAHSGEVFDNGYASPLWNEQGYMLYDGPTLVFHDRFVNFNYDENTTAGACTTARETNCQFSNELDAADRSYLAWYNTSQASPTGVAPPTTYEGDAAFGWFQSNQNSYPTGTATKQLMFVNTNLRHQVYTADVGLNTDFNDGDKNTSILDEDGTLSGFGVKLAPNSGSSPVFAISLNNLPFNGTSNSVDECLSRGGQNELYEGRTSALMSPASLGTLQFSSLYPDDGSFPGGTNSHWQQVTFTRDDAVSNGQGGTSHPTMIMKTGRNGLGSFEPKVSNGYGYTVTVQPTTSPDAPCNLPPNSGAHCTKAGIASWSSVTLADVVDPNITQVHPFYIQLGISYTNKDGTHPANDFTIERGYKSYYGGVWTGDPEMQKYWSLLDCTNLDSQHTANLPTRYGGQGYCPAASNGDPVTTLTMAPSIASLTNANGTPNLNLYYYDQNTGYLYFNVVQDVPNPVGPSPTGSCDSADDGGNADPACPDTANGETYYACPKNGCVMYTIQVNDSSYDPGPSQGAPAAADEKPAPAHQNQLVLYGTHTVVTRTQQLDKQGVPYYTASNVPACTTTAPAQAAMNGARSFLRKR